MRWQSWAWAMLTLWLAGCSTARLTALPTPVPERTQVRYATWDNNQIAPLRRCADAFEAGQPGIRVAIEQYSWNEYLRLLDLSMLLGDAPDVFAVHRTHLPVLREAGALRDLSALTAAEAPRDLVSDELQRAWQRDGVVYGLAHDWEMTVLFYNADMLSAAGISAEELAAATWNIEDGGSFRTLLRRLTRDANGVDAGEPQFDPALTVQFGWLPPAGSDGFGQVQWSSFVGGNGVPIDNGERQGVPDYADARFAAALQWYADLALKEQVAPGYDATTQRWSADLWLERVGAITIDGSWMIDYFAERADFTLGVAPLPRGPQGRMSMVSGSADAIWSGTQKPEAAWLWLRYLAGPACAELLGASTAILPAERAGTAAALAALAERGIELGAVAATLGEEGGTQQFPITDQAETIHTILRPLIADVMRGAMPAGQAMEQAQAALAGK